MRVFLGMILGALLLTSGVSVYDSQSPSTVPNGQAAAVTRTTDTWDDCATDWHHRKHRAGDNGTNPP